MNAPYHEFPITYMGTGYTVKMATFQRCQQALRLLDALEGIKGMDLHVHLYSLASTHDWIAAWGAAASQRRKGSTPTEAAEKALEQVRGGVEDEAQAEWKTQEPMMPPQLVIRTYRDRNDHKPECECSGCRGERALYYGTTDHAEQRRMQAEAEKVLDTPAPPPAPPTQLVTRTGVEEEPEPRDKARRTDLLLRRLGYPAPRGRAAGEEAMTEEAKAQVIASWESYLEWIRNSHGPHEQRDYRFTEEEWDVIHQWDADRRNQPAEAADVPTNNAGSCP